MRQAAILTGLALALTACSASPPPAAIRAARPVRIVSLDYCADQHVLKLADRDQIAAVSDDAGKDFSYMRAAARGVPQVRPALEDVLALHPDLVVRSYGGGPRAADLLERAGIPVLQIGYAENLAALAPAAQTVGEALGQPDRGQALADDIRARLARLTKDRPVQTATEISPPPITALYLTSGGVSAGPGTLIDDLIQTAGLANFETRPGWVSLDLERLVHRQPDMTAAAFFNEASAHGQVWSSGAHPVVDRLRAGRPGVALQGAWTSCGGWFLLDAVEALASERRRLERSAP